MDRPTATIIIPCYNAGSLIVNAVRSIQDTQLVDYEIIIVDDGSTDGSEAYYRRWEDDHTIIVTRQQNLGVSAARNAGLRLAKGKYIFFLDADDLMCPRSLNSRIEALEKGYDIVFGDYLISTCEGKSYSYFEVSAAVFLLCSFPVLRNNLGIHVGNLGQDIMKADWSLIHTSTFGIRADLVNKVGWFDENMSTGEDTNYWYRALGLGQAVCLLKPLAIYNVQFSTSEKWEIQFKEQCKIHREEAFRTDGPSSSVRRWITARRSLSAAHGDLIYRKYAPQQYRRAQALALLGLMYWPLSTRLWKYLAVSLLPVGAIWLFRNARCAFNRYRGGFALAKVPHREP